MRRKKGRRRRRRRKEWVNRDRAEDGGVGEMIKGLKKEK